MAVSRGMAVPVFVAAGAGAWGPVQELRGRPEIRLVASPRRASVLLIAGRVAASHVPALDRVHDQMPHPRAVVAWSSETDRPAVGTAVHDGIDALCSVIGDVFARLRRQPETSTPDLLADEDPNEWRGVGPFGQGGEGMMGGTPYGRPMAMTGEDRDGLALDQLRLRLGPFLEWLPPGVSLDVTMQGEVLQEVVPRLAPPTADDVGAAVLDAATGDVADGLRWLALGLHIHGLGALSARAASLAGTGGGDPRAVERLCRSVRRSGLLWSVRGVGWIDGLGDVSDRWQERLERLGRVDDDIDAPGPHVGLTWSGLADELRGSTLTDAVSTVVSLHDRLVEPIEELTRP